MITISDNSLNININDLSGDLYLIAYPENDEQNIIQYRIVENFLNKFQILFRCYLYLEEGIKEENWNGPITFMVKRGEKITETWTRIYE